MARNPKVAAAYDAMANLGIHVSKVKPVLKKLLKLYDKNWELIEEENYRALADAIFEEDENEVPEPDQKKKNKKTDEGEVADQEAHMHDEPLRPLKRLRLREKEVQSSHPPTSCGPSSAGFQLKTPKLEDDPIPESSSGLQPQSTALLSDGNVTNEVRQVPPQDHIVDKGKQPASPHLTPRGRRYMSEKVPPAVPLIKPKDEPIDDLPDFGVPIAVIPPEPSSGRKSSMNNGTAEKQDDHDAVALQCRDGEVGREDIFPSSNEEAATNVVIASSAMGEVKAQFFGSQEGPIKITPTVDVSKESEAHDALIAGGNQDSVVPSCISNGSVNVMSSAALVAPQIPSSPPFLNDLDVALVVSKKIGTNDFLENDDGKELEDAISPNSRSLVVIPKHHLTTEIRTFQDANDLTKGEESVKISWVNDTTSDFPLPFHYICRSLVFQDAYVNISLSHIGNDDCCSTCMGNCVLSSTPCSCANKTGGEFAYTAQGLLKDEFLEECLAISRNPQHYFYCKDCPLERSMNDDCLDPCKGHLKRKFIKECWSKCGCGKYCGNRVVQRGITCQLQVFFTSDGKGWGLRTLEDLPKGAFVCEFVGEILTVKELHERNSKYPKNGKHTYPIILDADWDSGVVKDKEALCLDAASYGNAARFINHRCFDANLVEIPVEIEGPDHHHYHFAFFTSRKIVAQEELTWDYGINFDDHDQPVKLFQCRCGSKFCRNMKRSNRSTRSSIAR